MNNSLRNYRKLSFNERLYVEMQDIYDSFAIQFIVEGNGVINRNKFESAVKRACNIYPNSRVSLGGDTWIISNNYPAIEYIENTFDGYNFNIDLFKQKLDIYNFCTTQILVQEGKVTRYIFRIFHGCMDERGALIWVNSIFDFLNGKEVDNKVKDVSDMQFVSELNYKKPRNKFRFDTMLKFHSNGVRGIVRKRKSIKGNFENLLSKVLKVCSKYYADGKAKFMLPMNIRKHNKNILSTSNLTLPIFINVKESDKIETISNQISYSLNKSEELNISMVDLRKLFLVSKSFRKILLQEVNKYQQENNKYLIGGIVSYLGKIDLSRLSTNDFKAVSFYSLPIQQPLSPLSIVICENDETTEIVISSYTDVISENTLEDLLHNIELECLNQQTQVNISESKRSINNITVLELFLKSKDIFSNNVAVYNEKKSITYLELDELSDKIAGFLKVRDVGVGDKVIIYLSRSIDLIASMLGVMKLGATYIPIDITNNIRTLRNIIIDSESKCIISEKRICVECDLEVINIKDIKNFEITYKPTYDLSGNHVIYQMYTSGSTGKPKGVMITDYNLTNYLLWSKKAYNTNAKTIFPLFTSTAVDLTVTSIFLPLISGGAVRICNEKTNYKILRDIMYDEKVNYIKCTPTHLKLIELLDLKVRNKKYLIVGGEKFTTNLACKIQERFTENCKIINEYGPTEGTVGCIYHVFDRQRDIGSNVPIGAPIDNTNAFIIDEGLEVKNGSVGEIYISGECVADGYSNICKENSNFLTFKGMKVYKTGDLGIVNKNNEFEYIGRNDRQVKINGFRVELEEIEICANKSACIEECCVILDSKGRLTIFYISDIKESDKELKVYLEKSLPSYMLPKIYKKIDYFPISQNGKIDEEKLKSMITPEIDKYSEELKICKALWSKALRMPNNDVNPEDSIYDDEGGSLSLLELQLMLSEVMKDKSKEDSLIN